jgi:hypothetical protein
MKDERHPGDETGARRGCRVQPDMRELCDVREVTDLQVTPQGVRRYVPTGSVVENPNSE